MNKQQLIKHIADRGLKLAEVYVQPTRWTWEVYRNGYFMFEVRKA
jgi:hypothetical protein